MIYTSDGFHFGVFLLLVEQKVFVVFIFDVLFYDIFKILFAVLPHFSFSLI